MGKGRGNSVLLISIEACRLLLWLTDLAVMETNAKEGLKILPGILIDNV